MSTQKPLRVVSRKIPACWLLELDTASWAELMTAVSIAIDATSKDEPDRAARLRTLRSQISKG
jgi:hypothetical protein